MMIVTETNVAHDENLSYLGNGGDEAHLVYNFALPPLMLHAFQTGQTDVLSDWAAGLKLPAGGGSFFNVLATHDGIGLNGARGILTERQIEEMADHAGRSGAGISRRSNPDGSSSPYEINANFLDALDATPTLQDVGLQAARIRHRARHHAIPGGHARNLLPQSVRFTRMAGWGEALWTCRGPSIGRSCWRQDLDRELSDPGSLRARILEGMRRALEMRRTSTAFAPDAGQVILRAGQRNLRLHPFRRCENEEVLCVHNVTPSQTGVSLLHVESRRPRLFGRRRISAGRGPSSGVPSPACG